MKTTLTGNPNLVDSGFDNPPDDPLVLLKRWLEAADQLEIVEPRGMVLSTVDASNQPSSRVVLLKTVDDKGVVFASSETSKKGQNLNQNPIAAGTLWWRETMQQINFSGSVSILPDAVADKIFQERTRESQATTAISHQSTAMTDEKSMRGAIKRLLEESGTISRPAAWHAYHIAIDSIEFWLGSRDRLHSRLRYDLSKGVWSHQKLQP